MDNNPAVHSATDAVPDSDFLRCFNMPSGTTITGRTSSIRNVFVAAIVSLISPSAEEIRQVLSILQTTPSNLECTYCGSRATEWDHLRPLVNNGKPTGYVTCIRNLVPSCGKCNQSKGKSDWKVWMMSNARFSPKSRGVADLEARIARLQRFEEWASCEPIRIEEQVDPELWARYYKLQNEILEKMREAQALALEISKSLKTASQSS
jgi:5-methylcytosine-specific restriction endonuclease McrA